ncbi:hypothetical protein [Leptospira noguchii]|uniref:hypothetical protein n=1 Tax=Leptospira noguchii TaxID=28182 RepID=UPI000568C277|nr:hypothetical protein [Leptospira noguchii]
MQKEDFMKIKFLILTFMFFSPLLLSCVIKYAPQRLIIRKEILVFCMNVEVSSCGGSAWGCDDGKTYECEQDIMLEPYFKGMEIEKRIMAKQEKEKKGL